MNPDHNEFRKLSEQGFSLVRLIEKDPSKAEGLGWQRWCMEYRHYDEIGFQPNHNAGIACGPASGVIVVDEDDPDRFLQLRIEKGWSSLPETRTHQTGKGGKHYLYQYPKNGNEYRCRRWPRICDLLGVGGQVVAPGSIHPDTGKPYTILKDIPIAPAPEWLLRETVKKEYRPLPVERARSWSGDIDRLPISLETKQLIMEGKPVGYRSEAIMTALNALAYANLSDNDIFSIFDSYPIGEKYQERRNGQRWLEPQIAKARSFVMTRTDRLLHRNQENESINLRFVTRTQANSQ